MSLAIDVDNVAGVLLADGVWYEVAGKSFNLASYEFVHEEETIHKGGQSDVTAKGFICKPKGRGGVMYGPLTAILKRYGDWRPHARSRERSAEVGMVRPGTVNRDNPDTKPGLSRL
jgi:hypothetical protein